MKDLQILEAKILNKEHVCLRLIKTTLYDSYDFEGVYMIYRGNILQKIGKTSGRRNKIERQMADRIWGLTFSDSVLRIKLGLSLEEAEECTARCLPEPNPLMRGRLEYYLMAKYFPVVNHAELER